MRVYEDKIYVFNVGEFPKTLDISKIYEAHISKPYNPKIAGTFFKAGFIESWGRGFEKIKEKCEESDAELPIVNAKGDGITIEIIPSKKYMELLNGEDIQNEIDTENDTENDTEKLVFGFMSSIRTLFFTQLLI